MCYTQLACILAQDTVRPARAMSGEKDLPWTGVQCACDGTESPSGHHVEPPRRLSDMFPQWKPYTMMNLSMTSSRLTVTKVRSRGCDHLLYQSGQYLCANTVLVPLSCVSTPRWLVNSAMSPHRAMCTRDGRCRPVLFLEVFVRCEPTVSVQKSWHFVARKRVGPYCIMLSWRIRASQLVRSSERS